MASTVSESELSSVASDAELHLEQGFSFYASHPDFDVEPYECGVKIGMRIGKIVNTYMPRECWRPVVFSEVLLKCLSRFKPRIGFASDKVLNLQLGNCPCRYYGCDSHAVIRGFIFGLASFSIGFVNVLPLRLTECCSFNTVLI